MGFLLSLFPITSGRVRIRKNPTNSFIYDKANKNNVIANEDLVDLITLCNGQNPVENIIHKIQKRRIGSEEIPEKVINTLQKLSKDNLISFEETKRDVPIKLREYTFKFPLDFVYFEPTRFCNFKCIHCYASSPTITRTSREDKRMGVLGYRRLIDRLDDMGVMAICVTGGEPFYREDLFEILNYIDSKDMEIGILSNGSLINSKRIKKLQEIKPKFIRVSFDSHLKEKFEKVRGKRNYDVVLKNIRRMLQAGLSVEINSILFRGINDSVEDLKGFLYFLRNEGIRPENITFDEFIPEGEGNDKRFYQVDRRRVVKDIKEVFAEVFFDFDFVKRKKGSFWNKYDGIENFSQNFCGIGEETCYINSNGNVSLCPALSTKKFKTGNVLEEDIQKIWEGSPLFDYFRQKKFLEDSECNSCESLSRCYGGCKAKSMTYTGKFNTPDPWLCTYFEVFK